MLPLVSFLYFIEEDMQTFVRIHQFKVLLVQCNDR